MCLLLICMCEPKRRTTGGATKTRKNTSSWTISTDLSEGLWMQTTLTWSFSAQAVFSPWPMIKSWYITQPKGFQFCFYFSLFSHILVAFVGAYICPEDLWTSSCLGHPHKMSFLPLPAGGAGSQSEEPGKEQGELGATVGPWLPEPGWVPQLWGYVPLSLWLTATQCSYLKQFQTCLVWQVLNPT